VLVYGVRLTMARAIHTDFAIIFKLLLLSI
jgi:hypothetical protein